MVAGTVTMDRFRASKVDSRERWAGGLQGGLDGEGGAAGGEGVLLFCSFSFLEVMERWLVL